MGPAIDSGPMEAGAMTAVSSTPDRTRLMQMGWGFAPPLMIGAAVELGLFDRLEQAPQTIDELAAATGASERGLAVLVQVLACLQLLRRNADDRYALTPESAAFLVASKPETNLAGLFRHVGQLMPNWLGVAEAVRSGHPATRRSGQPDKGEAYFAAFVEGLLPLGWPAATALAEHLAIETQGGAPSVLDIGAGSGVYSIPFALRATAVTITAVDLAEVLAVTRRIAERYGVGDRLRTIAGDMAEVAFGGGYRVVVLGQILHSYDAARNRALLAKSFDALAAGGTIAIAEFLVEPDRSGPLSSLIFAANMLVNTEGGGTYSYDDIKGWLDGVGFVDVRTLKVPGPSPLILATRP
jgi:2-polyprenyl-3-methyl-5-hydroxy-6-metoxy-1,4-benzoquinol methylase